MAISQPRLAVFTSQAPWGKNESFVLTEIAELFGDGCGILVRPTDARELADAIQRVMENSDYRATLIEAGFARVSADFNIRTVTERLVALMEAPGGIG